MKKIVILLLLLPIFGFGQCKFYDALDLEGSSIVIGWEGDGKKETFSLNKNGIGPLYSGFRK